MSTAPLAYAIDFGTTNSLIAAAYPDAVEVINADAGQPALRSLLFLHRDSDAVPGAQALTAFQAVGMSQTSCGTCPLAYYNGKEIESDCVQAEVGGRCNDARLLSELKSWLADDDEDVAVRAWAKGWSIEELVAQVMRRLKARADVATGHDVRRAVVGHPVVFDGAHGEDFEQLQLLAKTRLERAAELAGFDEVVLLDEPTAASHNELPEGTVMAVDFGGGTFDVAVIDFTPDAGHLLALQGVAIGGEAYDGALLRHALGARLGLDHPKLPNWVASVFGRRRDAINAIEGGALVDAIKGAGGGNGLDLLRYVVENGFVYSLFDAVEAAKIKLSDPSADRAEIFVKWPAMTFRDSVTVEDLRASTAHLHVEVVEVVDRALGKSGKSAQDIDLVVRTGGASEMKPFLGALEERFGRGRVVRSDTASMVVQGLGLHAIHRWGG